jgi:hypothetical protein
VRRLLALVCLLVTTFMVTPARAQDPVAAAAAGLQQEALPPVSATVPLVIFVTIWNAVDTPLQAAAGPMVATTAATTRTWLVTGLTLWLALWCAGHMFPSGSSGSMFFSGLFRELILGAVALTIVQIYAQYVVPFALQDFPGELTALFTTGGAPTQGAGVAAAYDTAWNTVRSLGHLVEGRIPDSMRPSILVQMLLVPVLQAVGFVFLAWAFFIALCMHIISTVLVVAGVIFVGLAAVPSTRRWAWGWLSTLLATIATVAFLALVLGLMLTIITQETQTLSALPETTDIYDQIDGFMGVVGCLFLLACIVTSMPLLAFTIFGGGGNTLMGGFNAGVSAVGGGVSKIGGMFR